MDFAINLHLYYSHMAQSVHQSANSQFWQMELSLLCKNIEL